MTICKAGLRAMMTGALMLPLLAVIGQANGASERWSMPSITPTFNDGLELTGVHLDGQSVLYKANTPFFMLDGQRYEFTETQRVAGPFLVDADGFTQVFADYEVSVHSGLVKARLMYNWVDSAGSGAEEAQLSAWVKFEGPRGDYRFLWRIDTEVGSRLENRLEVWEGRERATVSQERVIDLYDDVRILDESSYNEQTQLFFSSNDHDNAKLYATTFHPGEAESSPRDLVGGESLDGDLVVWYETYLPNARSGLTGPDMYATAAVRANAIIEQDKMVSASFVEESVVSYGETRSIQSGFATAGINIVDVKEDKSNIPDDASTTNAELHSMMVANKTYEYQDSSSQWYSWVGVANKSSSGLGVLGIMFDDGSTNTDGKPRQGCAVFYEAHDTSWPDGDSIQGELLLSMTHETGHCYNQHHEDFCPGRIPFSSFRRQSSIMGYAFMDTNIWTFSTGSIYTMSSEPEQWSRPGHGVDFTSNGSYNMTDAHSSKHVSTSCRWFCCFSQ